MLIKRSNYISSSSFLLHNLAHMLGKVWGRCCGRVGGGVLVVTKLKLIITDAAVTANKLPVARNVTDIRNMLHLHMYYIRGLRLCTGALRTTD